MPTEITPPTVSPYLDRPLRSEYEARDAIAEEATRAFWEAVRLGQPLPEIPRYRSTAHLLQAAKTYANWLWDWEALTEEEYNAKILARCLELTDGDELRAKLLASVTIGSTS